MAKEELMEEELMVKIEKLEAEISRLNEINSRLIEQNIKLTREIDELNLPVRLSRPSSELSEKRKYRMVDLLKAAKNKGMFPGLE